MRVCPTNRPGVTFQASQPAIQWIHDTVISLAAGPYSSTLTIPSSTAAGAKLNFYYDLQASGDLNITAGITTQSIEFKFFGSCLFCITIPTGINSLNFSEWYTERAIANVSVSSKGHADFDTGDLNGPPDDLASFNLVNEEICCDGIPIVNLNLDLDVAAEYQFIVDHGSWLNLSQGSTATYSQNYSFETGKWTYWKSGTTCYYGTVSTLCTAITRSQSLGGSVILRLGPELVLTLSAGIDTGIFDLELAGVTLWAFLYGQASLYFGVGPSPSVYTGCGDTNSPSCKQTRGGSCGSNPEHEQYTVWGLNPNPMYPFGGKGDPAGQNFWAVLCAGVGLQFGGSFNVFSFTLENPLHSIGIGPANIFTWTLWHGSLFPTQTFYFFNGTLGTSLDVCDVTQVNCTGTFTGEKFADNGTEANPGPWEVVEDTQNILVVDTALHNVTPGGRNTLSLPGVNFATGWISPLILADEKVQCGNVTLRNLSSVPVMSDPYRGPWNVYNFTAFDLDKLPVPIPSAECWVDFWTGSPLNITSFQFSNVNLTIRIVPPPGPEYSATFSPASLNRQVADYLDYTSGVWTVNVYPKSGSDAADAHPTPIATVSGPYAQNISVPGLPSASYSYSVTPPSGVTSAPITGSFTINYASTVVDVTFVPLLVKIHEAGLQHGTSWGATIDGTSAYATGSELDFNTTEGKFAYSVYPVTGCTITSGGSGTVTLSTKSVIEHVVFSCSGGSVPVVPSSSPPTLYPVQLDETGLSKSNDQWTAFVNGGLILSGSQSTLSISLPNGTYSLVAVGPVGYTWSQPVSGGPVEFTVDGAAQIVDVVFVPFTYSVTIMESGLAPGTSWDVSISHGTTSHSYPTTSNNVTVELPNGTGTVPYYEYSIQPIPGYEVVNASWSGGFNVKGADEEIVVEIAFVGYTLTFVEYGLLPSENFNVSLDGRSVTEVVSTLNSSSPVAFNNVPNGTYSFSVVDPRGYSVSPSSGYVIVDGTTAPVNIYFTASVKDTITFLETGLPSGTKWTAGVYDPIFGGKRSSTTDEIQFSVTPGYYVFFANTSTPHWNDSPYEFGCCILNDEPVTLVIPFWYNNSTSNSSVARAMLFPPDLLPNPPPQAAFASVSTGGARVSAPDRRPRRDLARRACRVADDRGGSSLSGR